MASSDARKIELSVDKILNQSARYIEVPDACEATAAPEALAKMLGRATQSDTHTASVDACEILEAIFRAKELVIDRADTVWKALRKVREGKADFADCVNECTGSEAGCEHTLTFDRDAAKWCGMRFIE